MDASQMLPEMQKADKAKKKRKRSESSSSSSADSSGTKIYSLPWYLTFIKMFSSFSSALEGSQTATILAALEVKSYNNGAFETEEDFKEDLH